MSAATIERRDELVAERHAEEERLATARAGLVDGTTRASDASDARERISALDDAIAEIDAQLADDAAHRHRAEELARREAKLDRLAELSTQANLAFATLAATRAEAIAALAKAVEGMVLYRLVLRHLQAAFLNLADEIAPGFMLRDGRSRKEEASAGEIGAVMRALNERQAPPRALIANWERPVLGGVFSYVPRALAGSKSHVDLGQVLPYLGAMTPLVDGLVTTQLDAMQDTTGVAALAAEQWRVLVAAATTTGEEALCLDEDTSIDMTRPCPEGDTREPTDDITTPTAAT